ncbi:MAG: glycosyltransferase family 39 protein [Anaerolineales bacterium]|nr:glycosyltransferase family 39 protein [Anaerolineales bacterium]
MKSFPFRIYLAALLLRLIPILLTRSLGIGLDDMFQYDMLARSLASGNGFRWYAQLDLKQLEPYVKFDLSTATGYDPQYGLYTSFRAPLYPAFLAIVYFFFGLDFSRFFAARLAQVIFLGAPLAPLTYLVSRKLLPDSERTSQTSAWLVAAYPMLLVYPLGLGTENPFFVLLLSSFLFLLLSIETPSASRLLLSGLFLAPHCAHSLRHPSFRGVGDFVFVLPAPRKSFAGCSCLCAGCKPVGDSEFAVAP